MSILMSICVLIAVINQIQAFPESYRTPLALPYYFPQHYYLLLNKNDPSRVLEAQGPLKRSVVYEEEPFVVTTNGVKRKLMARIGKRLYNTARIGKRQSRLPRVG